MKKIIIILLTLVAASCSTSYKCQKALKTAEKYGCLKKDSSINYRVKFIKGDTQIKKMLVFVPQTVLDTLWKQDTCYTIARSEKILKNAKIEPKQLETEFYKFSAKIVNGELFLEALQKPRKDTTAIVQPRTIITKIEKRPWWDRLSYGFLLGFLIYISEVFIRIKLKK